MGRMRWTGHVAAMEKRNFYRFLVGQPEGKRTLGRPKRRWLNNIKFFFVNLGFCDVDRIGPAQEWDQCIYLVG
jgi:hypothetical protein